ncbi:DUF6272 family protein [Kovacikia minuta CCNUW1]|uniref:DUF6272 family protein n=1 Tax=Kovacikia minuta TaxID=2931930 RepID=UPI001CCB54A7|nr:DUF6272 family protein [Kovacikia minuta]UBF23572.1 DUF6272 family protein [Kovacikia minuta CCNUW1]
MPQVFGEFIDNLPKSQEYLLLGFSPSSVPLQKRWRNNGLSADFLADYLVTFFPGSEDDSITQQQAEVKSAVNYVANELLENAMKFNDESSQFGISIQLQLHPDRIVFIVTNSVTPEAIAPFQATIQTLITADLDELYIQQLERNAVNDTLNHSGLGLLTMMNDYQAKIGWKFETISQEPACTLITTMVQLAL